MGRSQQKRRTIKSKSLTTYVSSTMPNAAKLKAPNPAPAPSRTVQTRSSRGAAVQPAEREVAAVVATTRMVPARRRAPRPAPVLQPETPVPTKKAPARGRVQAASEIEAETPVAATKKVPVRRKEAQPAPEPEVETPDPPTKKASVHRREVQASLEPEVETPIAPTKKAPARRAKPQLVPEPEVDTPIPDEEATRHTKKPSAQSQKEKAPAPPIKRIPTITTKSTHVGDENTPPDGAPPAAKKAKLAPRRPAPHTGQVLAAKQSNEPTYAE